MMSLKRIQKSLVLLSIFCYLIIFFSFVSESVLADTSNGLNLPPGYDYGGNTGIAGGTADIGLNLPPGYDYGGNTGIAGGTADIGLNLPPGYYYPPAADSGGDNGADGNGLNLPPGYDYGGNTGIAGGTAYISPSTDGSSSFLELLITLPPEGPPYPPISGSGPYGDHPPCPVGTISFKGVKLGAEYPRDKQFSYASSPNADIRKLTAGLTTQDIEILKQICKNYKITIRIRPTSQYAPDLLKKGAVPKPDYIKSKSINEYDLKLNKHLSEKDLGKVAFFQPEKPTEPMDEGTKKRYEDRLEEYNNKYIRNLIEQHENWPQLDQRIEKEDKTGIIKKVVEVKDNSEKQKKSYLDITSDHDIFEITDSDTDQPIVDKRRVEIIYNALVRGLSIQHPWQAMWDYRRSDHKEEIKMIDEKIIEKHMSEEELLKISADGSLTGEFIDTYAVGIAPFDDSEIVYEKQENYGLINDPVFIEDKEYQVPLLKNPGYKSKAWCRGACGEDCDENRCMPRTDIKIPIRTDDGKEGTCIYKNVSECYTHQGCRDHDDCFDWCAENGETSIYGPCHEICNFRCFRFVHDTMITVLDSLSDISYIPGGDYMAGFPCCAAWAGLSGYEDQIYPTPFDGRILFSNPPEFQEITPTPTPTPTIVSSQVEESCSKGYEFYSTASLSGWEGTEISGDYFSIRKKIEGSTSTGCSSPGYIETSLIAEIDNHMGDSIKIKKELQDKFQKEVKSQKNSGNSVSTRPISINEFTGECYETELKFTHRAGLTGTGAYLWDRGVMLGSGYLIEEKGRSMKITYQAIGYGCYDGKQYDYVESETPAQFNEVKSVISSIQVKCRE